jgi:putative ABC transport system permease protein
LYADPAIFRVFTHPFLAGDPGRALNRPNTIVLCESVARKYFDDENPIGKYVELDAHRKLEVTGVIADLPDNLHLKFRGVISLPTLMEEWGPSSFDTKNSNLFWSLSCFTYVLMREGSNVGILEAGWPAFYKKYLAEGGKLLNSTLSLKAVNLRDIHFHSKAEYDLPKGNLSYIYLFIWAAGFILLIASINYMNLATARASVRSKEVAVRKVVGGERRNIIAQFIGESVSLSFLALIISLSIVEMMVPWLNRFTGHHYHFQTLFQWQVLAGIILLTIVVGLFSGSYPSLFLASFHPMEVLKGRIWSAYGSGHLRRILVIFQFTVSIVMVTLNIVASEQVKFLYEKDTGFDSKNTVVLFFQDTLVRTRIPEFRAEVLQNPQFRSVVVSSISPGITPAKTIMMVEQGEQMIQTVMNVISTDTGFLRAYQIPLILGKNFQEATDSLAEDEFLVNETAARKFGWDNPIGKKLTYGVRIPGQPYRNGKIIGMVRDFNYKSLHNPVEPLLIMPSRKFMGTVSVKYAGMDSTDAISALNQIYRKYDPKVPMDYFVLDQLLASQYEGEDNMAELFSYLSLLCILIALLGLLGLSSFVATQRTREIGVRKVLGASIPELLILLNREFALLVVIAFFISIPIAWYISSLWLKEFAFHISVMAWPFLFSGAFSLLIALLTTSIHSLKVAGQNPVLALKGQD